MIWDHSETKSTMSSPDEGDVPGTAASLPIDAFPPAGVYTTLAELSSRTLEFVVSANERILRPR